MVGKINKKTVLDKNHEGYYPTYYRPNLNLKSGKPIFFKKKEIYVKNVFIFNYCVHFENVFLE